MWNALHLNERNQDRDQDEPPSRTQPPGSADAFEAMIGPAGQAAVDHSDVFALVNMEALRPFLEDGFNEAMDGMEMMGPGMAGMGPMIDMYRVLGERLFEDGRGAVLGVGFGQNGLTFNSAAARPIGPV